MAATRMGRPTACTPEVTADICKALSSGTSLTLAANYAGISLDSVRRWILRGDEGEEPYASFAEQVRKAEAGVLIALSAVALKGARDDPRLALRFLELHPRADMGRSQRHEVSGPGGAPLTVDLDPARLHDRVAELLAKARAGDAGPDEG